MRTRWLVVVALKDTLPSFSVTAPEEEKAAASELIADALRKKIPVVPVLPEDTSVPPADDFSDELKPLAYRNACFLNPRRYDIAELLCRFKSQLPVTPLPFWRRGPTLAIVWLLVIIGLRRLFADSLSTTSWLVYLRYALEFGLAFGCATALRTMKVTTFRPTYGAGIRTVGVTAACLFVLGFVGPGTVLLCGGLMSAEPHLIPITAFVLASDLLIAVSVSGIWLMRQWGVLLLAVCCITHQIGITLLLSQFTFNAWFFTMTMLLLVFSVRYVHDMT